jgi:hypothetical protein
MPKRKTKPSTRKAATKIAKKTALNGNAEEPAKALLALGASRAGRTQAKRKPSGVKSKATSKGRGAAKSSGEKKRLLPCCHASVIR